MTAPLALQIVALLDEMIGPGLDVEVARGRLAALAAAHPGVRLRLVCEREQYAGAIHPEVVAELPDATTLVIGRGRDRALPFLARAAFRPSEDDLLRVDGEALTIPDAIEHLELAYEPSLCRRLVDGVLLGRAARALGPDATPVSDDELQAAMDDFRRGAELHRAEDLHRWLAERGMTQEMLEMELEDQARTTRLTARLVADRARAYFDDHRADFDQARLSIVVASDAGTADLVAARLRAGDDLIAVLDGCDPSHVLRAGIAEPVRRRDLPAALAGPVFAAPGCWIGPVEQGGGFVVARAAHPRAAAWDDDTRAAIGEVLLGGWLAERRAEAHVEWFWGRVRP